MLCAHASQSGFFELLACVCFVINFCHHMHNFIIIHQLTRNLSLCHNISSLHSKFVLHYLHSIYTSLISIFKLTNLAHALKIHLAEMNFQHCGCVSQMFCFSLYGIGTCFSVRSLVCNHAPSPRSHPSNYELINHTKHTCLHGHL